VAEVIQNKRAADGLDDVVGRDGKKEIEEREEDLSAFPRSDQENPFRQVPDCTMHPNKCT
jgi:hypothetical protein